MVMLVLISDYQLLTLLEAWFFLMVTHLLIMENIMKKITSLLLIASREEIIFLRSLVAIPTAEVVLAKELLGNSKLILLVGQK